MRLCRFALDDVVLSAFYADDRVIPIDQAAEAYCDDAGVELLLPSTSDLLELLPPNGTYFHPVRDLARWIEDLDMVTLDELAVPLDEIKLLTPIEQPRKILLLAGNYVDHIKEGGGDEVVRKETFPYVFMKPPTTLTHPGDPVILPAVSPNHIDWECELGVVIGQTCRSVDEADALSYVAGYTVVNDISDRKFTPNPSRKARERDKFFDWMHGKWHDTFCPVGPCVLSADSVANAQGLSLRLMVNDELKQEASTSTMIFPVAAIVSFLSRFVTLEQGDIISTGTPAGVGASRNTYLRPGDILRATIDGIGTLENPVEREDS